jgi:DNA-binding NarL/FixJ family response regulator
LVQTTFLVVDDHPLFLDALKAAIECAYPGAKVLEASSIEAATRAIAEHKVFDLVLLDLTMPGISGFDGLLELRSQHPSLPIVIVSAHEDPRVVHEAMTLGANGFIPKSVRKAELTEAIRKAMAGVPVLPAGYQTPPKARASGDDLAARLGTLTRQQLRVLQMLRQGKLNKQIAHELDVGETTVKAHVSEILRKLNVVSRTQAVIEVSRIEFAPLLAERPNGQPRM